RALRHVNTPIIPRGVSTFFKTRIFGVGCFSIRDWFVSEPLRRLAGLGLR
ncbi:hypothetical protein AL68_00627, partial [Mycobacterium tuberculosis TKK_03_0113]